MDIILEAAKISFKIQKRYYLNFLFNIISSVFTFVPFIFVSLMFSKNPLNYIMWVVSGSGVWIILSQLIWSIGLSVREEIHEGTLEEILLSPTKPILVFIGKSIPSIILSTITSFLTLLVIIVISGQNFYKLIEVFLLTITGIPLMLGISILVSILVLNFKEVFAFLQVLMICFSIFIGITFPIENFPNGFIIISKMVIISKIIKNIRGILLEEKTILDLNILSDSLFTIVTGLIFLIISIIIFESMMKKLKKKGNYNYV